MLLLFAPQYRRTSQRCFKPAFVWPIVAFVSIAGACLGLPSSAQEAASEEPSATEIYKDAFAEARATQRDLLVFFAAEDAAPPQEEFATQTLANETIKSLLDERFVLVRLAKGDSIEKRTTEARTKYVRQRFRSVKKTYNQVVVQKLLEEQSRASGFTIVRANGDEPFGDSQLLAWFPFEDTQLPPQIFRRDPHLKPWTAALFEQIIRTPLDDPDAYMVSLTQKGPLQSAVKSVESAGAIPTLGQIKYDYEYSKSHLEPKAIATKIHLAGNEQLALVGDPVDVRVDVYSLKNSSVPVKLVYLTLDTTDDWQDLRIEGLEPETPYQMDVHFYRPEGGHPLIGKAKLSFMGATCGKTRLSKARAKVAMSALSELNDWQRGQYGRKGYVVGAWCERFYFWNIAKFVLPPYRTGYTPSTFSRFGALVSGSTAKEAVTHDNAMGDHVRISGHGFMVLCYDKDLNQVWCIEGNYGNRVVITKRSLSGGWSLGRLNEEMLLPEDGA